MEEKEMFELQCLALRKDSKMYKDRIEAILQQMEEVAIERDQVGAAQPSPDAVAFQGCSCHGGFSGSTDKSSSCSFRNVNANELIPFLHLCPTCCQEVHAPPSAVPARLFPAYL